MYIKSLGLDSDTYIFSSVGSGNSVESTKEQSIFAQVVLSLSGKL